MRVSEPGSWAALGSLGVALLLAFLALRSSPKNWLLEYYRGPWLEGPVTRAWIQRADLDVPHTPLLTGLPDREDFSLRLQSCLVLSEPARLVFRLDTPDRARLYVDGNPIIVVKGKRGGDEKAALELESGSHALAIEYVNRDGAARLRLRVKQPGTKAFRSVQALTRRPNLDGQCDAN